MTVLRGAGPGDGTAGGYDTRWLDLRAAADTRSRSTALLDRLVGLTARDDPHLLDLGCGGGAMQRWCADRLGGRARWTLVDPDEQLLEVAAARAGGPVGCRQGTVTDLGPAALADVDAVVCSALLDVLPAAELQHLTAVLVEARVPLLASLTVTGKVSLLPLHAADTRAGAAVHRTATADGATGPAAVPLLRTTAATHGLAVAEQASPWLLDPKRDRALVQAWTAGYVAAAVAGAAPTDDLTDWAHQRLHQGTAGTLTVRVDHADVLVMAS